MAVPVVAADNGDAGANGPLPAPGRSTQAASAMPPASERPFARGFAADAETERALRAGLSNHEARIRRGRFDAALRTLAAEPSAKLVCVDFDGVPEPEAAVRKLTAVCAFGTALVVMGSTDTAHLTRVLLREGIFDYLVKPISAAAVRGASAAALDDLPERLYAGRVVAFAGTAGNGVSTLIAALARGVAAGRRTAGVVDLAPGSVALPALLGTEPAGDLTALLAALGSGALDSDGSVNTGPSVDPALLDSVCAPADTPGTSLVAYPGTGPIPESPSPPAVHGLLGYMANRTHVVLVAGLDDPEARTAIMREADARLLLYEPTLPSIGAAVSCMALLGTGHPALLVQSHPRMRRSTLSQAQIRYALAERRPDVIVPFDPALHAAATGRGRRRPPGKAYLAALRQVMEHAVEVPAPASL